MKHFILILLTLTSSLATALESCPNMAGNYVYRFRKGDERKELEFTIVQTACQKIEFKNYVLRYNNGTVYNETLTRTDIIDGKMRDRSSNTWITNGIEIFQENAYTGPCNERSRWELDAKKNIRVSFRAECTNGNSNWSTPESTQGWVGELWERK